MASVFLYHVVGDLTVGKPELVEFTENETVEAAIKAIGESTDCGIPVWKKRSPHKALIENSELRHQRFVGILNPLDIVAFLARDDCLNDPERAIKSPVSEVVVPDNSLLREVDPGTRLIDALEIMKHGVRRLLVPKSIGWKGMSKRFSILYNGKWLKNIDSNPNFSIPNINNRTPSSTPATIVRDKYCCLSREDVISFLIGCLGALAPLPLSSISSLGAVNPNYSSIEASSPAIKAAHQIPREPSAFAVVELMPEGQRKILGEISASKLWKCDHLAAAWALANLSAGQFVTGVEDNLSSCSLPDFAMAGGNSTSLVNGGHGGRSMRQRTFSSRSISFFNNPTSPSFGVSRSMYRGRSVPLTCKPTSSLAAVMAQMLSHRATHVWVTEVENEDVLVGLVGYADILAAVTRQPPAPVPETHST